MKTILIVLMTVYVVEGSCLFAQDEPAILETRSFSLAGNHEKFLGSCYDKNKNPTGEFLKYWNQVTPENAGKWAQ